MTLKTLRTLRSLESLGTLGTLGVMSKKIPMARRGHRDYLWSPYILLLYKDARRFSRRALL